MPKNSALNIYDKPPGPLADCMRPKSLDEFVGQEHLVGPQGILRTMLTADRMSSVIFWGPPGVGKTTLAQLIAGYTNSRFVKFSAVTATLDDIRAVIRQARELYTGFKQKTILFIDEIHRFNKLQQDAFLPSVEDGTIILIGATTENPSFEIIAPLLSRTKVFILKPLGQKELRTILTRALTDPERGLGGQRLRLEPAAEAMIISAANGDSRIALNILEDAAAIATSNFLQLTNNSNSIETQHEFPPLQSRRGQGEVRDNAKGKIITKEIVQQLLQHQILRYDKQGDEHYNTISAFIKSMRGSDPNATLYYLARMLHGGESPLFIARRMVIFASEDVGMADPHALPLAIACMQAVDFVGLPEAQINLAHVAVYLATAKKSNASYVGLMEATQDVASTLNEPIPLHILNAPTKLMKDMGYHKGYQYPHDHTPEELKDIQYLPEKLKDKKYYRPKNLQAS